MKSAIAMACGAAFIAVTLLGCDSGTEWHDAKYEVQWIDTFDNRTLARRIDGGGTIGRVEPEVVAIGVNADYIVVQSRSIQTHEVAYFLVDKKKDNDFLNGNEIAQGPMSKAQFEAIKAVKALPEFTETFGRKP